MFRNFVLDTLFALMAVVVVFSVKGSDLLGGGNSHNPTSLPTPESTFITYEPTIVFTFPTSEDPTAYPTPANTVLSSPHPSSETFYPSSMSSSSLSDDYTSPQVQTITIASIVGGFIGGLILGIVGYRYYCKSVDSTIDLENDNFEDERAPLNPSKRLLPRPKAKISNIVVEGETQTAAFSAYGHGEKRHEVSNDPLLTQKYKINIKDCIGIEIGKSTEAFQESDADEDLCLSLIFPTYTVDIVADSKNERDSLVKGFEDMLAKSDLHA